MNKQSATPRQNKGSRTDASASVALNNETAAKQLFELACARLRDVNHWENVCDSNATNFDLLGPDGKPAQRDAKPGDYLRINIPGPGNSAGNGFDWVKIEDIALHSEGDSELYYIRVRPTAPPGADHQDVAHFFGSEATSTFMVSRKGNTVSAEVHGRNERPNTSTKHLADKIRNAVVGTSSALGFSLPQWKMLVNGLVRQD